MSYVVEGLGLGWIAIGAAGFFLTLILAKLVLVTDANASKFATWASCGVAVVFALVTESSTSNPLISLLGRVAVFGLVWLVFGLVFAIGVGLGLEKATRGK